MTLLLLLACKGATPLDSHTPPEPRVALDAPRALRRASLDLRGVLPSVEELDRVEADPQALPTLLDEYLASPLLEEQLVRSLGDHMLTRLDEFEVRYSDYGLDPSQEYEFLRSVAEEPLRLMARVVVEDRPWTDIVTAPQTVANPLLAQIWPINYPSDTTGWQWAEYTDGRPAAGVLATNGLWWRYVTSPSNKNRSRIAAISQLLLCEDILSRPVSFSGASLSIEQDPQDAIAEVDACKACHAAVEPAASTLFGFYWYTQYSAAEMSRYHPEREMTGPETLGVQPAWYGKPLQTLADLGPAIAYDPRFARCAAETVAKILWYRQPQTSDFDAVEALRQTYLEQGQRIKPVMRAALLDPRYALASVSDDAPEVQALEYSHRLLSPGQLVNVLRQLTGYRWSYEGWDQLDNDVTGYRVLAGGVDGYLVTETQREPGLTQALVTERVAEASAAWAVEQELTDGGERALLLHVTLDSRPGDEDFTTELQGLRWRLNAQRADPTWLEQVQDLWTAAYTLSSDPALAWTTTLSALLRDPDFVTR